MDGHRNRGDRRYQTWRHSRRAWRIHQAVSQGSPGRNCDCAGSVGRYRKAKAFSCRCRSKQMGAPKLAGSAHKSEYKYRTTVMRRIWNKRLAYAWHTAVGAGEPDDIELPSGPVAGRRRHTRTW